MRADSLPVNKRSDTRVLEIISSLRPVLLCWFEEHARKLPWRAPPVEPDAFGPVGSVLRRSPYAAWVAEIMLQQTQVATVVPYFEKWMRRFPDAHSLAAAPEEEVLRLWAGLGYYARARNLQRAAQVIAREGQYPLSAEGWLKLPGIGAYTSGAIASLAFNLPEPILDGNVTRVLSRVFGLAFLPGDGSRQREAYWKVARLWAQGSQPGNANEALMELGALVCTPSAPRCIKCPFNFGCMAQQKGRQDRLPPAKRRTEVETVTGVALVVEDRNRVLMEMRPKGGFLAGHLAFPLFLGEMEKHWKLKFLKQVSGFEWVGSDEAGMVRHSIMNKRYVLKVLRVKLRTLHKGRKKSDTIQLQWVRGADLDGKLTNSLVRKIWNTAV